MQRFRFLCILLLVSCGAMAQSFMMNPYGRSHVVCLNGKWQAIIDRFERGEKNKFYENKVAESNTEFVEYGFSNGLRLDVPGDFNSQLPELKYYEGNVWYQRYFTAGKTAGKRTFIYFAGVSYQTKIWLNGELVGTHEGGFTPFQFEVTALLKEGENDLVVLVNNQRRTDGIPAMNFDWWNYGGIMRDVFLIETPQVFVNDYLVLLKKGSTETISGFVQLQGATSVQKVMLSIPALKVSSLLTTDNNGYVAFELKAKPQLWSPTDPKLYPVSIAVAGDTVSDRMGFRTIEAKGTEILLNGKKVFFKGVNFHEEIPQRMGRAYSEADAAMIIGEVKALGCNFVRTAHYPQNEHIVRMAEKEGIMIWEEIPLWQGIEFTNPAILKKAENMLREMVYRDKNRAGIVVWSVANETKPSQYRDKVLTELVELTHRLDATRLVGAAFDNLTYKTTENTFVLNDNLSKVVDIVGVNKYLGWYMPWPVEPSKLQWQVATDKPLIISEFGCESLYGKHGFNEVASSWSEDYMANNYRKNLETFKNIKNLCGTSPWVLFDFRSPFRMLPGNQDGWNRKGLVSDKGMRKKAWYVMKNYYESKK